MHPSLTINQMSYRGYLEGSDVYDAICSSFEKMPEICKDGMDKKIKELQEIAFRNEERLKKDEAKVRKFVIFTVMGLLLAL